MVRALSWLAICCATSSLPPLRKYSVIPVARNVWRSYSDSPPNYRIPSLSVCLRRLRPNFRNETWLCSSSTSIIEDCDSSTHLNILTTRANGNGLTKSDLQDCIDQAIEILQSAYTPEASRLGHRRHCNQCLATIPCLGRPHVRRRISFHGA